MTHLNDLFAFFILFFLQIGYPDSYFGVSLNGGTPQTPENDHL